MRKIIPFERYGVKVVSMASMLKNGQPLIWRGPMRSKIINQFLADVEWGELDFLIADLPPGTGDEILTIAQHMKPDYAVIVTTPQEVSVIDAERAVNMAKKLEIPNISVVENMSGFVCPHCGNITELFGSGGGEKLADAYSIPFLGSIPIDIDARILGDRGKPIILEKPESGVTDSFMKISQLIKEHLTKELTLQ
jgi:ATP-binding protein involved in chromosome partitioning